MPLDGRGFKLPVEVEPFKGGREGLAQLSAALRREMPDGFSWNFGVVLHRHECGSAGCAVGLAVTLWPRSFTAIGWDGFDAQTPLELSNDITQALFQRCSYEVPPNLVTPTMVADRIDHWLATGEIK